MGDPVLDGLIERALTAAPDAVYLTDTGNPGEMLVYRDLEARARALGLESRVLDGVGAAKVGAAFASMQTWRVDALVVATTASLLTQRRQIVDGAARLLGDGREGVGQHEALDVSVRPLQQRIGVSQRLPEQSHLVGDGCGDFRTAARRDLHAVFG